MEDRIEDNEIDCTLFLAEEYDRSEDKSCSLSTAPRDGQGRE